MKFALIFPAVLNGVFGVSSFVAARWLRPITDEIERVTIALQLEAWPDPGFLKYILIVFGWLYIALTLGLLGITIARLL